jgi:MoxR-like ATPase
VRVEYPSHAEELQILDLDHQRQKAPLPPPSSVLSQDTLFALRDATASTFLDPKLNRYIVDVVQASRQPGRYDPDLARWSRFGASPRASIALARCARARAWLDQRDYVSPDDIQAVIHDVMRHRVLLSYEAEADGVTVDQLTDRLLDRVPVP